jgi:hypothetical protein
MKKLPSEYQNILPSFEKFDSERKQSMPSFQHIQQDVANNQPTYVYEYPKKAEMVATSERFCIDSIYRTTKPDTFGKLQWKVRIIRDTDGDETRGVISFESGGEYIDNLMVGLRDAITAVKGSDDTNIHCCFLKQLAPKVKGQHGAIVIEGYGPDQGCACGYHGMDDGLGDLDDHLF